jgi:glycosyltransferase involved in cell wall biosynthesis
MVGYLQDIYPDVAVALRKVPDNWAVQRLRKSLFSVYQRCDRVVVLSGDMKRLLISAGIQQDRIRLVPNWADPDEVFPVEHNNSFRTRHGLGDQFVVMYSGNLGLTQRLEEFIEAARLLADDRQISFAFVGQGSQRSLLEKLVRQKCLANVRFFDYQPKHELAQSLGAANLHLVPLTRELSQCLMPSKLYGILAAGRPFLTNAVQESELHQLTRQHNIGFTVEPGSPAEIARAIRAAERNPATLKEMSENARRLAVTEFTREKSVEKFRSVLNEVVGRP